MRHPASTILATLSMFIWIPLHCTNDPVSTAGGTDTGNAHAVAGRLYHSDGIEPAAGVAVAIRPRNTLADTSGSGLARSMADTATVITDDSGRYAFDSTLDTGTYVIEAASGNDAVLIDPVSIKDPDTTVDLPPDTLKPAGALRGVINLSQGGDLQQVFVLAFGIDRFATVDSLGRFRFEQLAEGTYDLRIISSLHDYGVRDTSDVDVVSADTTNLDTLELPFTGIPNVEGLSLSYDTLKQIVTLTWNQADTGLVQGYNVYRTHEDSTGNPAQLNAAVITDTVFRDSTALQDNSYTYRVKSVDRNGNEGLLGAKVGVEVVSGFKVVDTVFQVGAEFYSMAARGDSVYTVTTEGLVQVFDQKGDTQHAWNAGVFLDGSRTYNALHIRSIDTVLIVDVNSTVNFYDSNGKKFFAFTVPFTVRGITVIDTLIYLAGYDNKRIAAYSMSGNRLFSWTERGGGTNEFGFLLELVSTGTDIFALESNSYPPHGSAWFLLKYDAGGQFLSERVFSHDEHVSIKLSEYNGNLYIASRSLGYMLGSDLRTLAKFSLFEEQTGILPLSSECVLVGHKSGFFLKYEMQQ